MGGKRLAGPEGRIWSLELSQVAEPLFPNGVAQPHVYTPDTDCLTASTAYPGHQKTPLFFPHLGIRGRVFLWKSTTRRRGCSRKLKRDSSQSVRGQGPSAPFLPPHPQNCPPQGTLPAGAPP